MTPATTSLRNVRTVGVAVDFSEQSERALAHARRLARRFDARLRLVHVTPRLESLRREVVPGRSTAPDSIRQGTAQLLAARVAAAREAGVEAESVTLDGDVVAALAGYAAEHDVDLMIVGTHGRTGLSRLFLGSVAERLTRAAECPVLVARGTAPPLDGYRNILVPTDFSDHADAALRAAFALSADAGHIHALHCWQIPWPLPAEQGALYTEIGQMREQLERDVAELGEELRRQYTNRGVMFDFAAVERPATAGIQEQLDDSDYDLVVMGSHGRSGIVRWTLGSVAEVTVRHAPCSALVVKP